VFLFPEGTRSPDGILKPFKPGAFLLAKKMKMPILPIAVSGTIKVLPKYSMNLRSGYRITVRVLDPIPFSEFSDLSVEDLAEKVRKLISANVEL
jgi:1-acyl-sn-glycerol-3-phosphate acyltransferase